MRTAFPEITCQKIKLSLKFPDYKSEIQPLHFLSQPAFQPFSTFFMFFQDNLSKHTNPAAGPTFKPPVTDTVTPTDFFSPKIEKGYDQLAVTLSNFVVARGRIELSTRGFSVHCSTD
jgi:hypothetical protein